MVHDNKVLSLTCLVRFDSFALALYAERSAEICFAQQWSDGLSEEGLFDWGLFLEFQELSWVWHYSEVVVFSFCPSVVYAVWPSECYFSCAACGERFA